MAKTRQCQIDASNRYNKKNTIAKIVRLNKKTDADIIAFLEAVPNQSRSIKSAIRMVMRLKERFKVKAQEIQQEKYHQA